jgi:hypothetical protein
MVIQALNLTAAYDPSKKKWIDLKASVTDADGTKHQGIIPAGWQKPWFMTVPGQWGSMCYDTYNDEVILFPLWACRGTRQKPKNGKAFRTALDLPEDAGVRAGHYGTLIYSCTGNTWTRPELGTKEMHSLRADLAKLIDNQREAVRASWKGLIALRTEKKDKASELMTAAGSIQKKAYADLTEFTRKLKSINLKGDEAGQTKAALANLASPLQRLEKAGVDLSEGNVTKLPDICSQQRAAYCELRLIHTYDLYVQPLPRSSTSIIYDQKNKCAVMAGGNHLDRYLNDTWVYDSMTRKWQRKAAAPETANWPGMCYDSKRSIVLYAAGEGTYAYEVQKDSWSKVGPGRPRGVYCDMAYDEAADVYVLNVSNSKYGKDETTYIMKPAGSGNPVLGKPEMRNKPDDKPFPPPVNPAALAKLANMSVNTWTAAKPPFEPTHRSWSTMSWDPLLRGVIYQGGGHAGTMDNQISAYFPESNTWVKSFNTQRTPPIFGSWSCAGGMRAFERGMGLSLHCRWYESFEGEMVYGGQAGFEWATRERPLRPEITPIRGIANFLFAGTGKTAFFTKTRYYDNTWPSRMTVHNLKTGQDKKYNLTGPIPKIHGEWSGICYHPDKSITVLHGAGPRKPKREDNQTWILNMKNPTAWKKLDLKQTTPGVGMAKLNPIPGTPYVVCAMPASNDLWVLNLDKQTWKPLPVNDGDDKIRGKQKRFDIYGQCVWDPHHMIFIMVGLRGGYASRYTFLLKPDFNAISWE